MEKIKVNRTKEGTLFEVVCAMLVVAMWIIAIAAFKSAPEKIPTHFNAAGDADAMGSPVMLFVIAAVGTLVTAICLIAAYHPTSAINIPIKVTTVEQYAKMVTMVRVVAVECAVLFIAAILMMAEIVSTPALLFLLTAIIILTSIYFTVKIYRINRG